MKKSYRNTSEIVENANLISTHLGLDSAIPVIKHGAKVDCFSIDDSDNFSIVEKLAEYINKGYQSKGLEFDAVILSDASEEVYNSDSDIDMKQLYVALTRALHECSVFYNGNITKPLNNCISLENNKQKIKTI